MKYLLKEDKAREIRKKYKNIYFMETVGLSKCYVSLILNRKKSCPKVVAYTFTKAIDNDAEILDFFEGV